MHAIKLQTSRCIYCGDRHLSCGRRGAAVVRRQIPQLSCTFKASVSSRIA